MKKELQEKIFEKYSLFFKTANREDTSGPIMPIDFGIEFWDGWYWLLDNVLNTIKKYCELNDVEPIDITQIKEKNGGLEIYYNGGNELIDGMIWFSESLSYKICEHCGTTENVGQTKDWIITLCENCAKNPEVNYNKLEWEKNS